MRIVLILVVFVVSACSNYHRIEPDGDRSGTDYFVTTTDDAVKAAGLPILRNVALDNDLTEIRIWVGFGPLLIQDMYRIYKSDSGKFEGQYIWYFEISNDYWDAGEKDEFYKETYANCNKIGVFAETESCNVVIDKNIDWSDIYKKLNKLDIWNMPDNSEVPKLQHKDIIVTLDGMSMVVELKKKGMYRSFSHRLSPKPIKRKYQYAHKIMDVLMEEIK